MVKERKNFVYGNEEEGIPGCIKNGIDEKLANHIWDEMLDFAKYAFNKSHAAAYAVVSYQTAYLKCYYQKEFMAALLTSVLGNTNKVSEYIYACRKMGIRILPPDINKGEGAFSVDDGCIRYGLSAIKSLGKPVIEEILKERTEHGPFRSLKDLVERLSSKEMNKRTVESLIKSGALDGLGRTRKQQMFVYASILESVQKERKQEISGQMSLLDFMSEDQQESFEIKYPDVGEYDKEQRLAIEKEVLGIYVSGHPLEDDVEILERLTTASTSDFVAEEETGQPVLKDKQTCIIGGIISDMNIKLTRNNQNMAFLTVEDLMGTVEVIVFPREFNNYQHLLKEDAKIFVKGNTSISEEESKMICSQISTFDDLSQEIWVQFDDKDCFFAEQERFYEMLKPYRGSNPVIVYCRKERAVNRLDRAFAVNSENELIYVLGERYGKENIRIKKTGLK